MEIQLIDGDGNLNAARLEKFLGEVKLKQCGLSYAVISVMGSQSSGKSTLLNYLFGTKFRMMNAEADRSQTTLGGWIGKAAHINHPLTLVIDLEGSDGSERGENGTTFENQLALFALAISDIVIINMWLHEIGREKAANKSLFRTVLQVMLRLFNSRKTTLMFVVRDYDEKTPREVLTRKINTDLQKIWDDISKPQHRKGTELTEFFKVEVFFLSHYVYCLKQFEEDVNVLRQSFNNSIAPGGLAGDRIAAVDASGFSISTREIWKVIRENKDLDLPSIRVMAARVRCEEISREKFSSFTVNKQWCQIKDAAQSRSVPGFGMKLSSVLDTCFEGYDSEAQYFDAAVRSTERKKLEEKLLQLVHPAFHSVLGHILSGTLEKFKEAFDKALNGGEAFASAAHNCTQLYMAQFDKGCADVVVKQAKWDTSKVREKLRRDIDAHIAEVRAAKLPKIAKAYEAKLAEALSGPVESRLDEANNDTWPAIRKLLHRETESAVSGLTKELSGFDMDKQAQEKMVANLRAYARGVVETKAREEAGSVLIRMKDRFSTLFCHESDSKPRVWTGKEDVRAITKSALSASLKLLSVMTAVRLDDEADNIENALAVALLNPTDTATVTHRSIAAVDPLASSSWAEVPSSKTLITPVQCKNLWGQFMKETEYSVTHAISAQVMAARVRCEEISREKFSSFTVNKQWCQIKDSAQSRSVPGFGMKLNSVLDTCFEGYDSEAQYFDAAVRSTERKKLEEKLLQHVQPVFVSILGHIKSGTLEKFKEALDVALKKQGFLAAASDQIQASMAQFDKECEDAAIKHAKWDTRKMRTELEQEIHAHIPKVRAAKLSELTQTYEAKVTEALSRQVNDILGRANYVYIWPEIRKCLQNEIHSAVSGFSTALSGFDIVEQTKQEMLAKLQACARTVVVETARQVASLEMVLHLMNCCFEKHYQHEGKSKKKIKAAAKTARDKSFKLLCEIAVICLDDETEEIVKLHIEPTLSAALWDPQDAATDNSVCSNTWKEVPTWATLLMPVQCSGLWRQFMKMTQDIVKKDIAAVKKAAAERCRKLVVDGLSVVATGAVGVAVGATVGAAAAADMSLTGGMITTAAVTVYKALKDS